MVRGDNHDGVLSQTAILEAAQDHLDAGVHVGDGAVVLGNHIVGVCDALGDPGTEIVGKGLKGVDGLHGLVVGIELVLVIEHALVRIGRQIGRVWVHVPQKEEPGLVLGGEPLHLGNGHFIEVAGLGRAPGFVAAPTFERHIVLKAACGGVPGKADARRVIAGLTENLG